MAEEQENEEKKEQTQGHALQPEEGDHAGASQADEPQAQDDHTDPAAPDTALPPKDKLKLKTFIKTTKGRVIAGIAGGLVLLVILLAVPTTRYGMLGLVIKKDVTLTLVDSKTGKPVSDAQADIPGQSVKSDNKGNVIFKNVAVGPQNVTVKKKYYKNTTQTVNVWITKAAEPDKLSIEAIGRQVPVKVLNKISGQPLEKATITAQESSTITDAKGEAVLIMPADKTTLTGVVKAQGYNDLAIAVTNTEQADDKNTFTMTPTGKIYFLSKRTGKINVMKSDLDGGNAQVIVQGTGNEDEGGTILLASRDWRYLMLKAKRDGDRAKLYLIDTKDDKMGVADEGSAEFSVAGWADHTFIYHVYRIGGDAWQGGQESIKSFNAENGKLTTLDTLAGGGAEYIPGFVENYYNDPILIGSEVIFEKSWGAANAPSQFDGKKTGVYSIKADGSGKKALVEVDAINLGGYTSPGYYQTKQYGVNDVYIKTVGVTPQKSYEYEDGKVSEKAISDQDFYKAYPTYLVSPSGKETFWSESRDGKSTLFVGDQSGAGGKEIASLSDYKQYGWYSDDYLLVSKNNSELYILSKNNPTKPLKVTDYHKPANSFFGYGGGYGGF
jgi:hypothetical protein